MTKRQGIRHVAAAAAISLTMWAVYYRYLKTSYGYERVSFSKDGWLAANAEARGHMVSDLLRRKILVNKTQEEVLQILGSPDNMATVDDMHGREVFKHYSVSEKQREFGPRGKGYLYGVSYGVGHLGQNPRAPFSFSYALHITFKNGVYESGYVDD